MIAGLSRVLAPYNTRATSAVGAAAGTALGARLYHDVTDFHFVRSLYQAVLLHGDQQPLFELAAIALGFALVCAALYIGAPWFVPGTAPPPSDDGPHLSASLPPSEGAVIPFPPAA